jgi:hypothetical protein
MDDGQKTPRGHPDFNSYVEILQVFITNGQTNRQTDRQMDTLIWCGLGNLNTCCAWAGGTFFPVVVLCQFLVLAGNRFWSYIFMYLQYNTVVVSC